MSTSVRLDAETERAVELLARRHSVSKSAIVRRAVQEMIERDAVRPYERIADLVGSLAGGSDDLSERTGAKMRSLLAERK